MVATDAVLRLLLRFASAPILLLATLPVAACIRCGARGLGSYYCLPALKRAAYPATISGSTLICIIGNLRGGDEAWRSMVRHLQQPLGASLALLVSDHDAATYRSSALFAAAKYVWLVREYEDWGVLIDQLLGTPTWRANVSLQQGLWGGVHMPKCRSWCDDDRRKILKGAGAITIALRMELLRRLDELGAGAYSRVVLTRSDYFYTCTHPAISAGPGEVHIPEGEDHMGINDRHAVFGWDMRRHVLGVLPWLAAGGCYGCIAIEDALRNYFASLKGALSVCRFSPPMFTVARFNESSRWRKPSDPVPLSGTRLWCKYNTEYECAARTCRLGWPYERCLPPDAPEWIRRGSTPGRFDALLGMGEEPARVIAAGEASKADAALARYRWLTSNSWLPADDYKLFREAKNRTHIYAHGRCNAECRRQIWSHHIYHTYLKMTTSNRSSRRGAGSHRLGQEA